MNNPYQLKNGAVTYKGNPADQVFIKSCESPSDKAITDLLNRYEKDAVIKENSTERLDNRDFTVVGYDMNHCMVILQEINLEKTLVEKYVNQKSAERPLMLIFCGSHSNVTLDKCKKWIWSQYKYSSSSGHPLKQGHEHFIDKEGNIEKIEDHPELFSSIPLPDSFSEETRLIIYHRYNEQFDTQHLDYVVDLVKEYHIPTICLMNDYEREHYQAVNLSSFIVKEIISD